MLLKDARGVMAKPARRPCLNQDTKEHLSSEKVPESELSGSQTRGDPGRGEEGRTGPEGESAGKNEGKRVGGNRTESTLEKL